eukprot:gene12270-biopygen11162
MSELHSGQKNCLKYAWIAAAALVVSATGARALTRFPPVHSGDAGILWALAVFLCAVAASRLPPARVTEGVMVASVVFVVLLDAHKAAFLDPRPS